MSYINGHFEWTVLIHFGMNTCDLSEIKCPNKIHSKYMLYIRCVRNYTQQDSVHTGPARRRNQHTDINTATTQTDFIITTK